jgi:hypothetical protein
VVFLCSLWSATPRATSPRQSILTKPLQSSRDVITSACPLIAVNFPGAPPSLCALKGTLFVFVCVALVDLMHGCGKLGHNV